MVYVPGFPDGERSLRLPSGNPGIYRIPGAATVPILTLLLWELPIITDALSLAQTRVGFDTSIASPASIVQTWSPTNNCWCIPTYVYIRPMTILNVTLGTLTNNTAAAGNAAPCWVDYTPQQVANALSTPVLYVGLPSNLTVTHSRSYTVPGCMD